jgi:diguanylate cyclase (GGDEF)-like protein
MENCWRISDRRTGFERRRVARVADLARAPSWETQRAQFITRYLFWALGLAYFNLGGAPPVSAWAGLTVVNAVLVLYGALVTFFLWHARRALQAPWRWRAAMWVDLATATFAVLADPTVLSPGYLAYIMVILGNGMRYGLAFYAEAVVGSFVLGALALTWQLMNHSGALSFSTIFFLLFGAIIVVYAYSLMAGFEKARRQLEAERSIDVLTGLLNRRALYERAEDLFRALEHGDGRLAVLFADLDRFKSVNDTRGHHAGDRVLADIARMIAAAVRRVDVVARYGGDEFILLLPETDLDRATVVARRLQEGVAGWSREQEIDLSFSIGLAQAPHHGSDLKTLLQRVDQAMYRSKLNRGRGGILRVEQALPV